ncbi:MAG: hypothetical protein COC01_01975 [Bacteroidetes bacterium]|nr:MAG: hypothetical protein COC01_01975 [Bacteroidota bacterium]
MIVLVTKLRIKNVLKIPTFLLLGMKAVGEAKKAKGNLHTAITSGGLYEKYSMTVWESEKDMLAYTQNGAHKKAMDKALELVNDIKVSYWKSDHIPEWEEVFERLEKV